MSYQADTTRMESTAQVLYETRSASSPTSEKGMMDDKKDLDAVGVSVTAPDHSNDSELEVVLDEAAIEAAGQSAGASAYVWMLTIFAGIGGALFG